jgi:hypothetical protein
MSEQEQEHVSELEELRAMFEAVEEVLVDPVRQPQGKLRAIEKILQIEFDEDDDPWDEIE